MFLTYKYYKNKKNEFDNETDYYGINGRTPESLLNHLCDEVHEGEGWSWSGLEMDIDLELD